MKIEVFALLAFCSSAEFKQLFHFVTHHLPSSSGFCTLTNKQNCYSRGSPRWMFGFLLGCWTRMPNVQWVSHFQEDLGFIHLRGDISWSGCPCSGRALPAFGGCASLGTADLFQKWVLSYLSGVAPYPLWSFIFKVVWTLSLKKSKHETCEFLG